MKPTQRAQRSKKFEIFERDWKFRSRLKISSEPPTAALFFVGKSRRRDWNFRARLKISIEIENFERDWIFWSLGPLGTIQTRQCSPELLRHSLHAGLFAIGVLPMWRFKLFFIFNCLWGNPLFWKPLGSRKQASDPWRNIGDKTSKHFLITSPKTLTLWLKRLGVICCIISWSAWFKSERERERERVREREREREGSREREREKGRDAYREREKYIERERVFRHLWVSLVSGPARGGWLPETILELLFGGFATTSE